MKGHFAAYSPDGKYFATVIADGTVKFWDAALGKEIPIPNQIDAGIGVDFSPDGSRLATIVSGDLPKIWDAKTGKELMTFRGHTDFVGFASFSPDGAHLLTASDDGTARVWDISTGREILKLADHPGWVWDAIFSPMESGLQQPAEIQPIFGMPIRAGNYLRWLDIRTTFIALRSVQTAHAWLPPAWTET